MIRFLWKVMSGQSFLSSEIVDCICIELHGEVINMSSLNVTVPEILIIQSEQGTLGYITKNIEDRTEKLQSWYKF